jgi:hypothetical protein
MFDVYAQTQLTINYLSNINYPPTTNHQQNARRHFHDVGRFCSTPREALQPRATPTAYGSIPSSSAN